MQYATLGLHVISICIAIHLFKTGMPWRRFGVTLLLFSLIGAYFYISVLFFDAKPYVASQVRTFFQALIWTAFGIGVASKAT